MNTFQVDDMTCGHCSSAITKAVKDIDAGARVSIDLATHRVDIVSAKADTARLSAAIKEAGYTPTPVQAAAVLPTAVHSKPSRCCCG